MTPFKMRVEFPPENRRATTTASSAPWARTPFDFDPEAALSNIKADMQRAVSQIQQEQENFCRALLALRAACGLQIMPNNMVEKPVVMVPTAIYDMCIQLAEKEATDGKTT